jgi:hypothetical protein
MSDQTLASAVERLEAACGLVRQRLAEENARVGRPFAPEEMQDSTGRYILLDALAAIVQAKAALEASARPVEGLVARPGDTLILRFRSDASPDQCVRFKEASEESLLDRLPGVKLVYLGGFEQVAVYRPEGEPA